jgi:hypothetical protein
MGIEQFPSRVFLWSQRQQLVIQSYQFLKDNENNGLSEYGRRYFKSRVSQIFNFDQNLPRIPQTSD